MSTSYRILVTGECWHGSNSLGLARGLRSLGHLVGSLCADQYLPPVGASVPAKVFRRLLVPFQAKLYNQHILNQVKRVRPHLVIVFKGNHVSPRTLSCIKNTGTWLCNFYPDVSMFAHRDLDPSGFSLYHHIFTTKSFGIADARRALGLTNLSFLPHGFDPEVHRPVQATHGGVDVDVSFIGTWSHHKQRLLEDLHRHIGSQRKLRIWGNQWKHAEKGPLGSVIVGHDILGDFYAESISQSKINLGLLSERRNGASLGDQITSRTFHIPASGGFLLHERTQEVLEYYDEGTEIACFSSAQELYDKVDYYLRNEAERRRIADAGRARCLAGYSLAHRAQCMIDRFERETG